MKLDKNAVLFNAAGGFAVFVVGAYFASKVVFPDRSVTCGSTYRTGQQMSLERADGEVLTSVELQSRLAGRDYGVLDNSRVVRVKGVETAVLEVGMPKGSVNPRSSYGPSGGVSFQWRPSALGDATAACLGYSVWIPADFEFKRGGTLPGLFGTSENSRGEERTMFAVRYMWREAGAMEILLTQPVNGEPRSLITDADSFRLPRGKWATIEQEVVLNTPGAKDGVIRVWVDGILVVDRGQLILRDSKTTVVSGVQADIHYGGSDASYAAPKDAVVRMTAFQLRTR